MPITFNCPCGKVLRVPDASAGRRVKCPACQAVATVPAAQPLFEVVEDEPPAAPPKARPVAKSAPARDDDDDDKPAKKKPDFSRGSRRRDDDDDDDDDRPRRRKRRRRAKTVSAAQVWVTVKRVCFGGLGTIILIGAVALTHDGIQGGDAGTIGRAVCAYLVGGSLLFAGITGRFAGGE